MINTYYILKRVFDIVIAVTGFFILIPSMLGVKIAYFLSGDCHSIFFAQKRVGKNGKEFQMLKFRSMVFGAEKLLEEMLQDKQYLIEWSEKQKITDDPRITKVGRWLRNTSLDELPQLINVLVGDMSIVGPRPLVPGELEAHNGLKLYQKAKPGLTGWWACNGRSNTNYQERLALEYFYIRNCSLCLDMICILKTISMVLRREGAK